MSERSMEGALYTNESIRRFAGLELAEDATADEAAILKVP